MLQCVVTDRNWLVFRLGIQGKLRGRFLLQKLNELRKSSLDSADR